MGCTPSQDNRIPDCIMSSDRSNVLNTDCIDKSCFLFNTLIGEGGFGKVYSAVLASTRNWFAVKEINKHDLLKVNECKPFTIMTALYYISPS